MKARFLTRFHATFENPRRFIAGSTSIDYNPLHCRPSAEELPDSDDTPVDNQLQHCTEAEKRALTEQQLRLEAEQLRLEAEQKAQILAQKLRELNIDPDTLT